MRKTMAIALILAVLFLLLPPALVAAQDGSPTLPHQFYGTVKIRPEPGGTNVDAPVGTIIAARVNGVEKGRIIVTTAGKYGGPTLPEGKLIVQDVLVEGSLIEFYINNYKADQTWEFDSGEITGLNLTGYVPPPPTISYRPSSFSFSATEGEANPPSRTLSIWNSSAYPGAMAWTVADNAAWLILAPTSGTSSGEHNAVAVSVNISGKLAGSYGGTITITAEGATNTPRVVPVSLTIYPAPTPTKPPMATPGPLVVTPTPGPPVVTPTPGPPVAITIEVTPEEASIEVGENQQFTATATYTGGSTEDVTADADWASSNTAVATVDAGLATGVGAGITRITATFEGISDWATLNVSVVLESIAVTPESASIDVDETQQFAATATYTDGSTADVTAEAEWASSDEDVATVAAGLATGVDGGTTEITANLAGVASGPATLTVTEAPPAIPWWIIGLIIGLLLLLALLLLLRRRMRRGEEAA